MVVNGGCAVGSVAEVVQVHVQVASRARWYYVVSFRSLHCAETETFVRSLAPLIQGSKDPHYMELGARETLEGPISQAGGPLCRLPQWPTPKPDPGGSVLESARL